MAVLCSLVWERICAQRLYTVKLLVGQLMLNIATFFALILIFKDTDHVGAGDVPDWTELAQLHFLLHN